MTVSLQGSSTLLEVTDLCVRYDDSDGAVQALEGVSMAVQPGEFLCVVGPSGCGKSTLLRVMAGLIPPSGGEIRFAGERLLGPSGKIGLIFQHNTLFPWLTVQSNVEFALKARMPVRSERAQSAARLIELVGLSAFADTRPAGLSGGMAQRASLARALATEPEILLLDEPFGALDASSKLQMHDVLLGVCGRLGMTAVFVTHDLDEAAALGDRVLIMTRRPGRVAASVSVTLARPRVMDGIRVAGFEEVRNRLATVARDLFVNGE